MLWFAAVFLITCCELTIHAENLDIEMHKRHKYAPKVELLKPKGFSITIEGSNCDLGIRRERWKRQLNTEPNITDFSQGKYGTFGVICSSENDMRRHDQFTLIRQINKEVKDKKVLIRGRLHQSRTRGKQCFIVLRQQEHTIQCLLKVGLQVSREMLKFASNIDRESIIDVVGTVQLTSMEIRSCTENWVEVLVEELWVVSVSEALPIQVVDCARSEKGLNPEGIGRILNPYALNIHVNQDKKLDYRVLDLRTPANQAIFRIESAVSRLFREILVREGFLEIHTPKIISAASEGGANVFTVSYFKTFAYLAQSPQFYKQMAIAADFDRVFTVGAVFRAEESHTSRHLTEFVGLDLEMSFKFHYSEVLEMIEKIFIEIFKTLQSNYSKEITIIRHQFHSEPLVFTEPPPRIKFSEAVNMLRNAGNSIETYAELTSYHEKLLGQLVREKYKSDFFVLDKYPMSTRPFYTMPDPKDPKFSNSYDIFIRGEEVMSGGQRIHDASWLRSSALQQRVDLNKIKAYIDAFRFGCPPHAGGGIGLERTVALFLGLDNVRRTSMFPRDPKRITP
ncbi:aspartate--tRNA ligase, cytoplasmic-like [Homalodisca vitripennis]|uniref:aspartate--tRNA ligase, cytoplasmic-like n=1 Tax=Homalodisca vitripennis TaxID=197043 RepID=UPI001EEAB784|nr:aspartate--tRNA ligase, cytoplasmic-like [Homalodisca vitripennis]